LPRKYKKRPPEPEIAPDSEVRILVNMCDICNNQLPETAASDDLEYRMDVVTEINDSYESEYDKTEPKLMVCKSCSKQYLIPSYY